ncbi:Uncharacterised protein [Listeria newyorkensis]|nr:Uncharacterised protein [Listeria newyorkensis]
MKFRKDDSDDAISFSLTDKENIYQKCLKNWKYFIPMQVMKEVSSDL